MNARHQLRVDATHWSQATDTSLRIFWSLRSQAESPDCRLHRADHSAASGCRDLNALHAALDQIQLFLVFVVGIVCSGLYADLVRKIAWAPKYLTAALCSGG